MPDIFINHAALTSATEELQQGQQTMANQLTEFVEQMKPHMANVTGALAEAWAEVQAKVNETTGRAHGAMQAAVQTLGQIHESHTSADARGAQIMGG